MTLIKNGAIIADPFVNVSKAESIPASGAVIVSLDQWQANRAALLARGTPVGVQLGSDQHPRAIRADLNSLAVVALEFPAFRDGRAYSYATLLRRYGYRGEIRAVGDVLLEQLHFMQRCGFTTYIYNGVDPTGDWATANADMSVWYQPTGDEHPTAIELRHRRLH